MKRLIITITAVLLAASLLQARDGKYVQRVFVSDEGLALNYNVIYPDNFCPEKAYPVLVLLHGSGERGDDNQLQLFHGGELLRTSDELCEVIVIVPQCPTYTTWTFSIDWSGFPGETVTAPAESAVKQLIDSFIALGFADPEKIYGTGLSMGGMGILDMTLRYPDYFAAVEPICGNVNAERCSNYKGRTAFRFFHGTDDKAVDPNGSRNANAALQAAGIESSLVEYPGVGHGSWYNAFAEPDFISWLLKH